MAHAFGWSGDQGLLGLSHPMPIYKDLAFEQIDTLAVTTNRGMLYAEINQAMDSGWCIFALGPRPDTIAIVGGDELLSLSS